MNRKYALILLALALAFISVGQWLAQRNATQEPPQLAGARLMPQPLPVPDTTLTDHKNQPFTTDQLRGRWTFAFFGYTHCPDVCPNTLQLLDRVADRLAKTPEGDKDAQFLFVSVDPERDPPEQLAQYVSYFNPAFIGATGSQEALQTLTRGLGIMYQKAQGSDADNYLVDHSASVLLIDPQARLAAVFPATAQDPDMIAADFAKIRAYLGDR